MTRISKVASAVGIGAGSLLAFGGLRRILSKNLSFKNKVVLITGSSRGLGFILARLFVQEGSTVILCARKKGPLEKAKSVLEKSIKGSIQAGQSPAWGIVLQRDSMKCEL